jgi:hypothetical protein
MRTRPTAIGREVVPTERLVIPLTTDGAKYPSPTPKSIAAKIQSVR